MGYVKGCTNESCTMRQKKHTFKPNVNFCPECGTELVAVCKSRNCYQVLDDPHAERCVPCQARIADRKDAVKDKAKYAAGVVPALGVAAWNNKDKVIKVAAKILRK